MHIEELRQHLLTLVKNNVEDEDVDFKREVRIQDPADRAEMVRDILSLANTTDRSTRDDAYLIIGAKGSRLFDVTPLRLDDSDIRSIVQSFISPHLGVRYVEVDNGEAGRLGAMIIERNGNWHVIKRELRSKDKSQLFLTPGETWSRKGSTKFRLDGDDLVRIMGEETQRKVAEAISPMADRVRDLEAQIAKLQTESSRIRPLLDACFVQSDILSNTISVIRSSPPALYNGPDLELEDTLKELEELGPKVRSYTSGFSQPRIDYAIRIFEIRRERITVDGNKLAGELKNLFGIQVNPELLTCDDVIEIETENPASVAVFSSERNTQIRYSGHDAKRYQLVRILEVAVERAKPWIEFKHMMSNVITLPLAVLNQGGASASGVVIEIVGPNTISIISPFDAPKMPKWALRQIHRKTGLPKDEIWMWRPYMHTKIDIPVDNYSYIAREWVSGPLFAKPRETDVRRYNYRTEIVELNDNQWLWRYRVENEVPHREGILLAECLILAPENDGEFHLNFTIRARELPDPVSGVLTLTVAGGESTKTDSE